MFQPYPDEPGGKPYYHFYMVEKTQDFRVDSQERYYELIGYLIEAIEQDPSMIPIVQIEDLRHNGTI